VMPNALAAAQQRQPRPIPAPAAMPARRPAAAAVRMTSMVSRPGVMVTTAANAAKASSALSTGLTITIRR